VTEPSQLPARFRPQRRATRARRSLLFILGPLLWLVALVVLAYVIRTLDAVGFALLVLAASLAVAVVWVGWTRIARAREERKA
jgi:hypothetical protein